MTRAAKAVAWRSEVALAVALVVAAVTLRLVVPFEWPFGLPVRDEAQYIRLAGAIARGEGLLNPQKWLWAPGYPYLLGLLGRALPWWPVTLTMPVLQALAGGLGTWCLWALGRRMGGPDVGVTAAFVYAVHPTLVYFSTRLWSEGIYGPLLIAVCLALLMARERGEAWGAVPGLLLGGATLFRGVALYMAPLFVLALLWPVAGEAWRVAVTRRANHGIALLAAFALMVAPYSALVSARHGGVIIVDASIGQSIRLGNNDYRPITFDYGNGLHAGFSRARSDNRGRPACADRDPVAWNRCETSAGLAWISENRPEFVGRIPLRTAQLLNPHTFLTRHVRAGKYAGLTWWVRELLLLYVAGTTLVIVLGGTLGAIARARGPSGVLLVSLALYTVAASAGLYGLSRFRLPVEALWIVYLAVLVCEPRTTLAALWASPARLGTAVVTLPVLGYLLMWFFPAAYPGFHW